MSVSDPAFEDVDEHFVPGWSYKPSRTGPSHRDWPGMLYQSAPGECLFCGKTMFTPSGEFDLKKSFCCKEHARDYILRTNPREARRFVFYRDKGICAKCDHQHQWKDKWECDHIMPLFMARGDWSYWDPDNLQVLCTSCHKDKTAADAKRYKVHLQRRRAQKARQKG